MFTGIIKDLGEVYRLEKRMSLYRLKILSKDISEGAAIGDSVSVNGVCLTVVAEDRDILTFDVMEETARKTNLGNLKTKDLVNLEGPLRVGDPLSGHFVLGHIDCVGKIRTVERKGEDISMEIEVPKEFAHLTVQKGSVAIDGISLTIGALNENRFKVFIIPHTLRVTTLGVKKIGDTLNVEFDILGKYVARLKKADSGYKITEEFLKNKGFS